MKEIESNSTRNTYYLTKYNESDLVNTMDISRCRSARKVYVFIITNYLGQGIYTTSVIFVKSVEFFRNYTKLAMSTINAYMG